MQIDRSKERINSFLAHFMLAVEGKCVLLTEYPGLNNGIQTTGIFKRW